jgi:hypothetical protein
MELQFNMINNQINNNEAAKSCLATKKVKIPTKWSFFLLWFICFWFVNHYFFNFVNANPLGANSRPKRIVFPNIEPTEIIKTGKQNAEPEKKGQIPQSEVFEIKFPGGGVINTKGVYAMGLLSATAALVFICDHIAKVVLCVVRRLNNADGNELEIQLEERRLVLFLSLFSQFSISQNFQFS